MSFKLLARLPCSILGRPFSTGPISQVPSKLIYKQYGEPLKVLSVVEDQIPSNLEAGQAHVKVLYSPINPSDLATIGGIYPNRPKQLPATPGLEGIVEVVRSVSGKFKPGDRCLVTTNHWGFWRQEGVALETELKQLPKELPAEAGATLIVNPCTAYLMINHIVKMEPGDSLIQNGANSALGQIVIQLAKAAGIKTINVIRNRPNLQETVDTLKQLGADVVITDEQLRTGLKKQLFGSVPQPKLGLECVGGLVAADLVQSLARGGTLAVYGRMSTSPCHIHQGDLIFRDIKVQGFYLTQWAGENPKEFGNVIKAVAGLYLTKQLKMPKFRKFPLEKWQEAIKTSQQGFTNEKILLQLN